MMASVVNFPDTDAVQSPHLKAKTQRIRGKSVFDLEKSCLVEELDMQPK